jgi:DNA invertase Pin-like site-specific DNA recombinase
VVVNIIGGLANIEHQQKLERVRSGIRAAQNAGKWTGRSPRGFTVGDDKRLRISSEEFLETREALARLSRGESQSGVAKDTRISQSALSRLYNDRQKLYLQRMADDNRVNAALEEIRPLDDRQIGD